MADEVARFRDDSTIVAMLARSNRLGADKRVTNFAGGNTSAKLTLADPITGAPTACSPSRAPVVTSAR